MANFSVKGFFVGLFVFFIVEQVVMFLFSASADSSIFMQTASDVGAIFAIILGILTYRHYKKKEDATRIRSAQQADQKTK